MGIHDDTAIFTAVIQQGGFSHAAKHLGLSNGLVSRRIAHLEEKLGVMLIKRTTRQLQLTSEGDVFWLHAQRIQQELDTAISLIQAFTSKPKGLIRVSAPLYFGRNYLTPIVMKFLQNFTDIKIDLILSNQKLDPTKEQLDLVIRGVGYVEDVSLQDSSLRMKLLMKEKIELYASSVYLKRHGEPHSEKELANHIIISCVDAKKFREQEKWSYSYKDKKGVITFASKFRCNDIESGLVACSTGYGIGKFTDLNVKNALQKKQVTPILRQYNWGCYNLYALYAHQKSLPQRIRLLVEFIHAHMQNL